MSCLRVLLRCALTACAALLVLASPVLSQGSPPAAQETDRDQPETSEEIRKAEEVSEEEKVRKFEQTQYELNEMGMSYEERKMRRLVPQKP